MRTPKVKTIKKPYITDKRKKEIDKAFNKALKQYGKAIRKLGKT